MHAFIYQSGCSRLSFCMLGQFALQLYHMVRIHASRMQALVQGGHEQIARGH